jgi:hypothetical protein
VASHITEDKAVDGGADERDEGGKGLGWEGLSAEFGAVFGPLSGGGLDAELAALEAGPPWQAVTASDAPGLLVAYRRACLLAEELRAALAAAGLDAGEVPGLCGSLNGEGRPVVVLGAVSAATAGRLALVLRGSNGRPIPPAEDRKGKAA